MVPWPLRLLLLPSFSFAWLRVPDDVSFAHTAHTLSSSRYTNGNATKCLTVKDLVYNGQPVHLPGAEMQENGKKMACLQCWGDWCHPFHGSQDPVCSVGSWDDSCSETGGGPDNLAAVARLEGEIHSMASWARCRRDNLKTESTCIDQRICPKPARFEHQHESDPWIHNCNQRFCYNASATSNEDCYNNLGPNTHGYWMEGWRAGAGLCNVYWHGSSHISTRAICEGAGLTWWEGRSFLEGSFNTKDTCKTFCDDGTWPPKQECGAEQGDCDSICPQCVPRDSNKKAGVCLHEAATQDMCTNVTMESAGYRWDWGNSLCLLETTRAECEGLAGHSFHTCGGHTSSSCATYCWAKDYTDMDSCWNAGNDVSALSEPWMFPA